MPRALALILSAVATVSSVRAQESDADRIKRIEETLERERARSAEVEASLRALHKMVDDFRRQNGAAPQAGVDEDRVRAIVKEMFDDPTISKQLLSGSTVQAGFKPDDAYQGSAFFIRSSDDKFLLNINGLAQFRYYAYDSLNRNRRDGNPDKSGANRDLRSDLAVTRFRMVFGGHLYTRDLTYQLQIDAGTVPTGDNARLFTAWVNWNALGSNNKVDPFWRDALQFKVGQYFTPFGRGDSDNAWGNSLAMTFQQIDRNIAFEQFRPERSPQVEVHGMLGGLREGLPDRPGARGFLDYHASLSNGWRMAGQAYGLDTDTNAEFDKTLRRTDKYPTLTTRAVLDLLKSKYQGEDGLDYYWFGRNMSDLEHHETLAAQLGGSFAWQRVRSQFQPVDNARLGTFYHPSYGNNPGSDVYRLGADVALKYQGFSLLGEYYYTMLNGQGRDGIDPNQNQSMQGFYVQGGAFVIPKTVELFGGVAGIFAEDRPSVYTKNRKAGATDGSNVHNAWQFTIGANWYPFHSQNLKLSVDASYLVNTPVANALDGYVASGKEDAWLLRAQLQFGF